MTDIRVLPQRIQLRRTRGWRKPEGCISVARPSRWGNPYKVERFGLQPALQLFTNSLHGIWDPSDAPRGLIEEAYDIHRAWTKRIGGHPTEMARFELAGRDLGCWCPPERACHAHVLLEVANA